MTCLLIVEPPRKLVEAKGKIIDGLRTLSKIPLFRRAVLGYVAYTAALGAFSFWAPKFLVRQYPNELDLKSANFWFGVITIVSGAIGTVVGGRWADRSNRNLQPVTADTRYDAPENKTGINALLRICAIGMIIAVPLACVCFFMPAPVGFYSIAFVAEIGLFLSTSPVNAIFLRAVPTEMRASAMAASIFAIHLFGDLWSSVTITRDACAADHVRAVGAMWWLRRAKRADQIWRHTSRRVRASCGRLGRAARRLARARLSVRFAFSSARVPPRPRPRALRGRQLRRQPAVQPPRQRGVLRPSPANAHRGAIGSAADRPVTGDDRAVCLAHAAFMRCRSRARGDRSRGRTGRSAGSTPCRRASHVHALA